METRIGIDIGGTFTDLVYLTPEGGIRRAKVLSTPDDYARGIAEGSPRRVDHARRDRRRGITQIMHGTTVATNALLEGKGAKVALLTTTGFRDVLEIRRLRMPVLYDIRWRKPPALVPRRLRFEVPERIDHLGRIERPLDEAAAQSSSACWRPGRRDRHLPAQRLCQRRARGAPARHAAELDNRAIPVTISSELLPEIREYERTSTTVVNATCCRWFATISDGSTRSCAERKIDQAVDDHAVERRRDEFGRGGGTADPHHRVGPGGRRRRRGRTRAAARQHQPAQLRHGRHDREGGADRGRQVPAGELARGRRRHQHRRAPAERWRLSRQRAGDRHRRGGCGRRQHRPARLPAAA
jgi:hypothetical protein